MNKRRNPFHTGTGKGQKRSVQCCMMVVAAAALLMCVALSSTRTATTVTISTTSEASADAFGKRISKVSQKALSELRETTAKAMRSMKSKERLSTPENDDVRSTEKREIIKRPSTPSIAQLFVNTSVAADLPPSDGLITLCRVLSHRSVATHPSYTQCTYGLDDVVSSFVHRQGYWRDCLPQVALATLARMYMPPNDDGGYSTVDVGGNIGACALLLGARGFYVTSFEPVRRNILAFHQSVFANSMQDRVLIVGAAASDASLETKIITIEVGNHGNSAVINPKLPIGAALAKTMEKVETERITTVRLDDLATSSTHVHFAKFDCQGCELGALRGAELTLLQRRAIDVLYVEVDTRLGRANGHEPLEMLQLLDKHAYRLYVAYGNITKRIESSAFHSFVEACVEDPRDVVAVSAEFLHRVPESLLRQVMGMSTEVLAAWLTNANYTDFGVVPMIDPLHYG
jgi:FkbM family methyltransferase